MKNKILFCLPLLIFCYAQLRGQNKSNVFTSVDSLETSNQTQSRINTKSLIYHQEHSFMSDAGKGALIGSAIGFTLGISYMAYINYKDRHSNSNTFLKLPAIYGGFAGAVWGGIWGFGIGCIAHVGHKREPTPQKK